ncbi:hypothetical protein N0V93_007477 [Gnomoniopsis smithogilvyi]|uniref:Cytochrome P450 n=1 Tax=Gnomoniopsis smithogilvyi TaxID=1191159 RepID=A0A9W9CVQ4_9PEZI|nr:hypothetical protein N0V93_007477 [Gnomoniopsis smithogilvyi]
MATANFTTILFLVPLLYLVRRLFNLAWNYLAARKTGLPVLVNPVTVTSPIWLFGKPLLKRIFASWDWIHRVDNFTQQSKYTPYQKFNSKAYWIVSNREKELYVADPVVAEDVYKRCRVEFQKNSTQYEVLEIFGPNVVTTNGKVWERHRKTTIPPFNERVSETVWDEAARQAEGARKKWFQVSRKEPRGVRSTQDDTTQIAFNVLSAAGFGQDFDFDDAEAQLSGVSEADKKAGHTMSYRESLVYMLEDIVSLVMYTVARTAGWPTWAMWGKIKAMGTAREEYVLYMREKLQKEREEIRAGIVATGAKESLMSVLVRNSDSGLLDESASAKAGRGSKSGPVMTDDEILGNLFVYNLAGHDTTAGALNFAVTLLACEPKWQEWIAEEIDTIVREDQTGLKYNVVFPKLHRCLALMYETLRMYGPVPVSPRYTAASWQNVTIDGKQFAIPPHTDIKLDLAALHHDPNSWGPDPLNFRPDRWIPSPSQKDVSKQKRADSGHGSYDYQSESLIAPAPGTFLPWTGGPRVCPGKKFSQVEFTRAILGMFRDGARVCIVEKEGESTEQARARVRETADKPEVQFTLRMTAVEEIGLKWFTKEE